MTAGPRETREISVTQWLEFNTISGATMSGKIFIRRGFYFERQGSGTNHRIVKFAKKKSIIGEIFTNLRFFCYIIILLL